MYRVGLVTDVIDDGFNGMIVKIARVGQILRISRFWKVIVKMLPILEYCSAASIINCQRFLTALNPPPNHSSL